MTVSSTAIRQVAWISQPGFRRSTRIACSTPNELASTRKPEGIPELRLALAVVVDCEERIDVHSRMVWEMHQMLSCLRHVFPVAQSWKWCVARSWKPVATVASSSK